MLRMSHSPLPPLTPTKQTQSKDNDGSSKITGVQLGDFYKALARDFPIVSIEDPFDQVRFGLVCGLKRGMLFWCFCAFA